MNLRRQLILDTAERLFNTYGYHDVGIDLIISESNVAKMTLYRNFSSKEDLIKAILSRKHTAVNNKIESLATASLNIRENIIAIFEYFSQWIHGGAFHGCMYTRSISEFSHKSQEILHVTNQHKASQLDILRAMFQKEYNVQQSDQLARIMLILLDGAILAEHSGYNENRNTLNISRDYFINSLP
ncbi:TetR/AcrR family transcriptional regulator [Pseudomonas graminis]